MKQIFVVYETDEWHSKSSQSLIGIYTSKKIAINAILKNHRISSTDIICQYNLEDMSKRKFDITVREILREQLEKNNQTQGFETNYMIEVVETNTWI